MGKLLDTILTAIPAGAESARHALEMMDRERELLIRERDRYKDEAEALRDQVAELRQERDYLARQLAEARAPGHEEAGQLAALSSDLVRETLVILVREASEGLGMPEPRLRQRLGDPHQAQLDLAIEELKQAGLAVSHGGMMGSMKGPGYALWCATSEGKRLVIDAGLLEG